MCLDFGAGSGLIRELGSAYKSKLGVQLGAESCLDVPSTGCDDAGGGKQKRRYVQWKEDPRHIAFVQTGCNLSQVLTVLYELSHGINYFQSKRLVKCGLGHKTQVRRQFEQLEALGYYDDIRCFMNEDGAVSESLPTAGSDTTTPDGNLRAARVAGYFKEGVPWAQGLLHALRQR